MTNDRKVMHEYAYVFESIDGDRYAARAAGSARPGAKFDGWVEFVDITGRRLATEVETVQPNERAFRYWAAGLTAIYLEGAFDRAAACVSEESPRRVPQKRAALDPFEVDIQG